MFLVTENPLKKLAGRKRFKILDKSCEIPNPHHCLAVEIGRQYLLGYIIFYMKLFSGQNLVSLILCSVSSAPWSWVPGRRSTHHLALPNGLK